MAKAKAKEKKRLAQRAQALALIASGRGSQEVAALLGVQRKTVTAWLGTSRTAAKRAATVGWLPPPGAIKLPGELARVESFVRDITTMRLRHDGFPVPPQAPSPRDEALCQPWARALAGERFTSVEPRPPKSRSPGEQARKAVPAPVLG